MEKITFQGKHRKDVVVYTQNVEDEAMSLILNIANHPVFENAKIRIMPDTHAGKGIVIGFTCGLNDYVNPVDHVIRKGAISSYTGEKMVIPFNMRDGLAICVGKSNDDWNCSAPHGAGRLMSRSKAKETVDLDEFVNSMEGIYSTSVGRGTLDESPMAYKDCDEIMRLIEPTAEILFLVKPKINIKAFDSCD